MQLTGSEQYILINKQEPHTLTAFLHSVGW
jgi:hypothetical protein